MRGKDGATIYVPLTPYLNKPIDNMHASEAK